VGDVIIVVGLGFFGPTSSGPGPKSLNGSISL